MAVTQSAYVDNIKPQGASGAHTDSTAAKDPGEHLGSSSKIYAGTVAVADGNFDADGDVIVLVPLHIDARVIGIEFLADDLDSGTDSVVNLGLYTDAAGTDVQDEDAYASAVTTFQAAVTAWVELAYEARDINKCGQAVWQDAGYATRAAALAEAKSGYLYLALTQTATVTTDAAGDITFKVLVTMP